MIKPVKSVTVIGESPTAEQNQSVNDWLRQSRSAIPRRLLRDLEARATQEQSDDQKGAEQNGGD